MRLEDCPVRTAMDVIGGKWKPVILYHLFAGKKRFGELRKLMPDAAQRVLTLQLRELAADGIVARQEFDEVPPKVEYSLTAYGKTLRPVMRELCKWGTARNQLPGPGRGPSPNGQTNQRNGEIKGQELPGH